MSMSTQYSSHLFCFHQYDFLNKQNTFILSVAKRFESNICCNNMYRYSNKRQITEFCVNFLASYEKCCYMPDNMFRYPENRARSKRARQKSVACKFH